MSEHMKQVDCVMWTKNGEPTLDRVLTRINQVIPNNSVNQRFIVDDSSKDTTRETARKHGWEVFDNNGTGISDGANTALKHVETEWFCSFEQDLLLSHAWWKTIPKQSSIKKVAAISGLRFASAPESLRHLQMYVYSKYLGKKGIPAWLRSREHSSFTLGKTLDNTLWNTQILRNAGGFPNLGMNAGIDTVLAYRLHEKGYKWIVDYSVKSDHLRLGGLNQELQHQRFYASTLKRTWRELQSSHMKTPSSKVGILFRLFTSPITGVFVAIKMHDANIAWIHPLIRWNYALGLLQSVDT